MHWKDFLNRFHLYYDLIFDKQVHSVSVWNRKSFIFQSYPHLSLNTKTSVSNFARQAPAIRVFQ